MGAGVRPVLPSYARMRSQRARASWSAAVTGAVLTVLVLLLAPGMVSGWGPASTPGFRPASVPLPGNLSGRWTELTVEPDEPVARADAAIAFDPVQGLGVLFGGWSSNGTLLNDTWVNDGDHPGGWAYLPRAANASPPPLAHAAFAYDPALSVFLLFGGRLANQSAYPGTWEFADFAWHDLTPRLAASPPPDAGGSLAFDSSDGYLVFLSSTNPAQTWSFLASGWEKLAPSHSPPPRTNAAAVSEGSAGGTLLFGGIALAEVAYPLNDTWIFANGDWSVVAGGPVPPGGPQSVLADDPRLPGVLLVASHGPTSTWTFALGRWSPTDGGPSPAPGGSQQFYFDSVAGFDILFGGLSLNVTVLSDVWGWSVPPAPGDATLGSVPVSTMTWVEVGALIAVPVAVAFLLRRRPPRPRPTTTPAQAPSAA